MIKQIQLRGISRTPSDRMTEDGGCAESLNVFLNERETGQLIVPEDISAKYGQYQMSVTGMSGPALYIHRSRGALYDNLIFLEQGGNLIQYYKKDVNRGPFTIFTLEEGETVSSVTSVGNTLIVVTDMYTRYALCKDGTYLDLGTQIPIPAVEFRSVSVPDMGGVYIPLLESFTPIQGGTASGRISRNTHATSYEGYVEKETYDGAMAFEAGVWQRGFANDQTASEYEESYKEVSTKLWDGILGEMNKVRKRGFFPCPVFVRYALKLYDGTYIYQSVPIMLGAGLGDFFNAWGIRHQLQDGTNWESYFNIELKSCYKATAYLAHYDVGNWGDIVESVDLFMSTSITKPVLHSPISGLTLDVDETTETLVKYLLTFDKEDAALESDRMLEEVLSKRNFFKIASFKLNDNGAERLEQGYNLLADDRISNGDVASEDFLLAQETLPDDFLSMNTKTSLSLYKYNNRIIMGGVEQEVTSGYAYLNGTTVKAGTGFDSKHAYEFKFYIKSPDNKELVVLGRNPAGDFLMPEYNETFTTWTRGSIGSPATSSTYDNYCRPYAWIAYPDPNCYQVDVLLCTVTESGGEETVTRSQARRYKMEAHPGLNCAYCFIGLDKWFGHEEGEDIGGESVHPSWDRTENRNYTEPDTIWASAMNNPFAFLADGRIDFPARIVGMASATKALSEGQFGQFPLYVFTEEGSWALPVSETGDFLTSAPLSRDVALSADSIIPIEQAVIFVTSQGVMALSGSQILNISPNMNGEHYVPTQEIIGILDGIDAYLPYRGAYTDDLPFLTFVSECKATFDYVGQRVIFFRGDSPYQYVYMLATQTWHKMSVAGLGYSFKGALNSYPDCYVTAQDAQSGKYRVKNMSVSYDPSIVQSTLPGLIITRAFDLGEPDIRKVIRNLRIRGQFNRGDVKYVLMGSFDGVNWRRLNSLRGGSYKLFRIALICTMAPTERVSWIDVDYETRFTNRLR